MLLRRMRCQPQLRRLSPCAAVDSFPSSPHVSAAFMTTCLPLRTRHASSGVRRESLAAFSPASSPSLAPSLHIPRIEFAPPSSLSHEGLAYAACPVCSASYHMSDMHLHLTTAHKQLDPQHCQRICQARLSLYKRVIGVPLERVERRGAVGLSTTASATVATAPATAAAGASRRMNEALTQLPTVTARGAYHCNWCVQRGHSFATRDAFLKHMIEAHPDLPLDDLEPHIPLPSARQPAATAQEQRPTRDGEDEAVDEAGWRVEGVGGFFGAAAAWPSRGGQRGPTRRLQRARPLPAAPSTSSPSSISPTGGPKSSADETHSGSLPARQVGITLPRGIDASAGIASPSLAADREEDAARASAPVDAAALHFSENHLPCELCGRVFESELNLLQHLENKHPTGERGEESSGADADIAADVAQLQREEASGATPGQVYALCDLCGASKVYTLPSALYAHIRFKHPAEDAAFQVERILKASKARRPLVCPHCARGFASQTALDGHVADKHSGAAEADGGGGAAASLPPVTAKSRWWCVECERGFAMAKALHGHMVSKHRMPSQVFPCPACKRVFGDVYSLEEHFHAQHKAMSLKDLGINTHVTCPECDRFFLSHEDLRKHTMRHHQHRQSRTQPPPPPEAVPPPAFETAEKDTAPAVPRKVARKRASPSAA